MSFFSVDVESDGPCPGLYSMVCFGAVLIEDDLKQSFYGQTKPISEKYIPGALNISGFSREDHLTFDDPETVMQNFYDWILKVNIKGSFVYY